MFEKNKNKNIKNDKIAKVCYLCQNYWNFEWYTVEKYFYKKYQNLNEGEQCDFCYREFSYIDRYSPFGYYIDNDISGGFMIEFKVGPFCLKCLQNRDFIKQCPRKKFYIDKNINNNIKLECLNCDSLSFNTLESLSLYEFIYNKNISNIVQKCVEFKI